MSIFFLHRIVAHSVCVESLGDLLLDAVERSAADEEDVVRVDLNVVLIGVLASALGGHVDDGAFEQFEHALLYTFAADVARDGGVVAFAGDLVNFVDEDDTALCASHIVVGHLQQTAEDAFHVFADVTGLREHRGVDNGEGHFEEFGDGARQEGFAGTGRTDHDDVALFDLHIVIAAFGIVTKQTLVVVVDRYGEVFFGIVLPDDVLVEIGFDLLGFGQFAEIGFDTLGLRGAHAVVDDFFGALGAVAADAGICAVDEHIDLRGRTTAKGAMLFV